MFFLLVLAALWSGVLAQTHPKSGVASTPKPAVAPAAKPARPATDSTRVAQDREADFDLFEAETYLDEKNYPAAVQILERILAESPEREDVLVRLAASFNAWLLALPDAPDDIVRQASDVYQKLLDKDPYNRLALAGLADFAFRYEAPVDSVLRNATALEAWRSAEAEFAEQMKAPEKSRDFTKAQALYRQALNLEPRHPAMYDRLARALAMSDPESREARNFYTHALKLSPGDPDALNGLAEIEIKGGRLEDAEKHLELAMEIEDQAPPGPVTPTMRLTQEKLGDVLDQVAEKNPTARRHFYLGRVHLAEGHNQEALKAFRTAADIDTNQAAYVKYMGIASYNLERWSDALGSFQKTLEKDPGDPDALFHIGSLLFELDHYDVAVQHLKPVADVPRYRARASRLLGLALTRVDEHSESAAFFLERAIQAGSDDPQLRCILGEQYLRLERWDLARARFDECLKALPDNPAGLLGSGLVADHDRKYERAAELLEKFRRTRAESPAVLMRLGLSYLKMGEADTAAARFREALGSDSTLSRVNVKDLTRDQTLELGFLILMAGKNYEDGVAIGEHLVESAPDNSGYANNLAMAYADADTNLDRALELAERANKAAPDNAGYMDTLGWTYAKLKRYKDAERMLTKAVSLTEAEPGDPSEIYYHMGYLLGQMNRNPEALTWLQKVLDHPGNPPIEESARKLIAKIQGQKQ